MAAQTPTFEPEKITAGDTATWKKSLADYRAGEGWALSYVLIKRGATPGQPITFGATASGDDYLVNVVALTTAEWPAGDYAVQAYVTKDPDRFKVWEGLIKILPNFAASGTGDIRSHARKVLDSIQAVLEKRATQEILEWTVEGVLLRKATVNDLLMLQDRYLVKVQKEEAAARVKAGKGNGRRILIKFLRPS